MEFFADAQRLFVGLGNGTIKVSREIFYTVLFKLICSILVQFGLWKHGSLQPKLPGSAIMLIDVYCYQQHSV